MLGGVRIMGIVNLTPDSFWESSRVRPGDEAIARIDDLFAQGADIVDIGAVSTRPGADFVDVEEEWSRLESVLRALSGRDCDKSISIDTTSAEVVRRAYKLLGPFIVNDISSGEDDAEMLSVVGELGLTYIAMHKRGNPRSMDGLVDYQQGIIAELIGYFRDFAIRAAQHGISDWILDPGLGFAKTCEQNWEILEGLESLSVLGRPILIGASDKRFTKSVPERILRELCEGADGVGNFCSGSDDGFGSLIANRLAIAHGAVILRVHDVANLR